jgi:ABC-type lipoprotein release transport system permease subunit
MEDDSLDNLFSEGSMLVKNTVTKDPLKTRLHRDTTLTRPVQIDPESGAFNLVSVILKPHMAPEAGVKRLNAALKEAGCGVRAVTWKKAVGIIGNSAAIIKAALFIFVMFLFFVAIIIIVNTLSMAAIERTSEIGMMRAVGAQRNFIRAMFFSETATLSAVFGGTGIVFGIIAVNIVTAFHITSTNDMVQLLFGGDTFRPLLSVTDTLLAVLQLIVVTFIAVLYPIRVASGITPLDAITRE